MIRDFINIEKQIQYVNDMPACADMVYGGKRDLGYMLVSSVDQMERICIILMERKIKKQNKGVYDQSL